jgi:hypothetical protein
MPMPKRLIATIATSAITTAIISTVTLAAVVAAQ